MPRIRHVKPETWDDEILGALPRDARLFFVASWNFADDEGRLRWAPALLKAKIFPYDEDLTVADVQKIMDQLEAAGRVRVYTVAAQKFAVIVNFHKHQRTNRPQPSQLPAPPGTGPSPDPDPDGLFTEDSLNDQDIISDDSLTEKERGKEKEEVTTSLTSLAEFETRRAAKADPMARFDEFWAAYPRRVSKRAAEKAWLAAIRRRVEPKTMIDGAARYAKECAGREAKYVKHPATWLNAGAYDDQPESKIVGRRAAVSDSPWADWG